MLRSRLVPLVVLSLSLVACGDGAAEPDAGAADAGAGLDAAMDAGRQDAGAEDAGTLDAGAEDAGRADADSADAATDAGLADSGTSDAGVVDGGACGCIDSTLNWRYSGGLVLRRNDSEIAACRDYTYTRTIGSGPTVMCEDEVPCAGDEATIGDVVDALADRQVQDALTMRDVVYGRDTRLFDGQVFIIEYRDREIVVGSPCAGTSGCIPIPAGIQTLKDVLESLEDERLESEPCVSVFPPS